jgi:hypothetical protein
MKKSWTQLFRILGAGIWFDRVDIEPQLLEASFVVYHRE